MRECGSREKNKISLQNINIIDCMNSLHVTSRLYIGRLTPNVDYKCVTWCCFTHHNVGRPNTKENI